MLDAKTVKENAAELGATICGRACDMACYVNLEEKGVLKRKFRTPFRKRKEWKFEIESFEQESGNIAEKS